MGEEDGGRGIRELETAIPAVDGLVTQSAVGLMGFFADCVPLFFYFTLLEKGVRSENIDVAANCTADNPECFFSHRRDGAHTGRMAGWIRLRGTKYEVRDSRGTK